MASPTRRSKRVKRYALRSSSTSGGDRSQAFSHEDESEHVYNALSSGAIAFLELREAVAVLNTCRLLRHDTTLAVMALSHTYAGAHLLHECAMDWMHVLPPDAPQKQHVELFLGGCRNKECRRNRKPDEDSDASDNNKDNHDLDDLLQTQQEQHTQGHHDDDVMNHALLEVPRFGRNGRYATQLLSLVGMMQEHLLPLCYSFTGLNAFGDLCSARPVLIPLTSYEPSQSSGAGGPVGNTWTLDDVKSALNVKWNLLGDDFMSPSTTYVHVSDVGAHWENIAVSNRNGKPSCAFCDASKKAVREYRREANAMLKTFNEVLSTKKHKWRTEGFDAEEIHQKRSELKARFFPEDSYPDVNFADSHNDDILADICESDRFPMNPFEGLAAGFDRANDDVFNALSEQYMGLCKSLYQPLKRVLSKQLALVGQRVHRTWMNDDDGIVISELVAGVSTSGFLCGVFIIVKKAEYEPPHSAGLEEEEE